MFVVLLGTLSGMKFMALETYAVATGRTFGVTAEEQNSDYESGLATIDGNTWHIRTARTTPTKPGGFVAFWQRNADGQTQPFAQSDPAAGLLVFIEQAEERGVFTFTSDHLDELGITSGTRAGKRGFRVYPEWCTGLNRQAAATQRAQAPAFQRY